MAEISTATLDNEGIAHLIGSEVLDIRYVDVSKSQFANPNLQFTGYGADGYYYTNGVADPTHVPYQAAWASEGSHEAATSERGLLDRFPDRIFVVTTALEVVIIDADSLDVWMRFTLPSPGTGYGNFLGLETTEINQASFDEGFLAVATDFGLRIADFRNDRAFALHDSASKQTASGTDIADRNTDGIFADSYAGNLLSSLECLCVDTGIVGAAVDDASGGGIVVAATGHDNGLTGIRLYQDSVVASPQTKEHDDFTVTGLGTWVTEDDNDSDSTTPYIIPDTVWDTDEMKVGDTVILEYAGPNISVTVTEVTPTRCSVTPEVTVGLIGTGHNSDRPVPSVDIISGGVLLFANGHQLVARIKNEDWYTGASAIDPRSGSGASEIVNTHAESSLISRVRGSGTSAYIATDVGIFLAPDSAFNLAESGAFGAAEFIYGIEGASPSPTYEVLEGSIQECVDVAVDPETGNVLVASTSGSECTITEIKPSLHQAFQFFTQDDLGGTVSCLVSYRNTEGPPDDETEVA